MTKFRKIALGLATIYPIAYIFLFLAFAATMVLAGAFADGELPGILAIVPFIIFPLHCLTMISMLGLEAFYVYHVIIKHSISDGTKIL